MSPSPDDIPLHRSTGAKVAVVVFLVLTLAYALLIAQQILAWVFLVVTVVVLWYAARLVVAMEEIATQLGRLADERTGSRDRGDESS
ncbi:hypothetical protein C5B91_03485 [Haloferax sp. Atlit-10N]|uniref:Uncharacterized protein n=1 Tax=Haloferax prahovense (strain DSM 18310 / JCM 13924 / TL6) TaxID=1227461 RepID=M0GP26_HALPT|nr:MULTISPECIES: hypothetical protein [Haloferax]ELZ73333.1 hypothetical protein C457_05221 [Haloferax prahovense DSM 18310]RDZ45987.1 hypothetical protein C5B86_09630 [Haloferax sp. Atlit-19N]RDZ46741.1 hypothetical protein C5B87_03485 [Haloferax sp. Atlit-16N]RDZ60573.1 hypothetical protein C5B91_03485 [Haloferax sp. Atlit-10N]